MRYSGLITDIPGIRVGQVEDKDARTGVSVVICEEGALCAADVRGAAPGTRETDLLTPGNLVERVHAILLAGGSAFGLNAAGGVMRALEEKGVGLPTMGGRVPIVPGAVLFDLTEGRADVRPDARMGHEAVRRAAGGLSQGSCGAGCGATVAKAIPGIAATRGGIGSASVKAGGYTVAALVAVNALGDVIDPFTGDVIAMAESGGVRVSAMDALLGMTAQGRAGENTSIGVIATDAPIGAGTLKRLCVAGHDGLALAIRPCHTIFDGDTLFALSAAQTAEALNPATVASLCAAATVAVARAVVNAVLEART